MIRSIFSGWASTVLSVVASYLTLPVVLASLGQEQYGLYLILSSTLGYAMLLTLGVPMAAVREFSTCVERKDYETLNRLTSTSLSFFAGIGCALLVVVAGAGPLLMEAWAHADPAEVHKNMVTLLLLTGNVCAALVSIPLVGLLSAANAFVERNAVVTVALVLRLGLTLLLLPIDKNMVTLAAIMFAVGVLDLVATLLLVRRRLPFVAFSRRHVQLDALKPLLGFGLYVLVLNAASQLSFQTDPVVIGATLGRTMVPAYSVANTITMNVLQLAIGIAAVIMPQAARAVAAGNPRVLAPVLREWVVILTIAAASLFAFAVSSGSVFIGWWLGPKVAHDAALPFIILCASFVIFLPARGVALPVLMGAGFAKKPTLVFFGAAVANVAISIVLARRLGLAGIALGTAIPNVIAGGYMLHLASKLLEMERRAFSVRIIACIAPLTVLTIVAANQLHAAFRRSPLEQIALGSATVVVLLALPAVLLMRHELPSFRRFLPFRSK